MAEEAEETAGASSVKTLCFPLYTIQSIMRLITELNATASNIQIK